MFPSDSTLNLACPVWSPDAKRLACERARRSLAEVPPAQDWWTTMRTFDQFNILDRRAMLRRFISLIEVRRVGKGYRVPVPDRAQITWRG